MTESVLEFLQGQNVRYKIREALMWLNVSGGMFNLPLCTVHCAVCSVHFALCTVCGGMFNLPLCTIIHYISM